MSVAWAKTKPKRKYNALSVSLARAIHVFIAVFSKKKKILVNGFLFFIFFQKGNKMCEWKRGDK